MEYADIDIARKIRKYGDFLGHSFIIYDELNERIIDTLEQKFVETVIYPSQIDLDENYLIVPSLKDVKKWLVKHGIIITVGFNHKNLLFNSNIFVLTDDYERVDKIINIEQEYELENEALEEAINYVFNNLNIKK